MEVLNFYKLGKVIPENAVYIGRYNAEHNLKRSPFANPHKLSPDEERGATIQKYKEWLWDELLSQRITKKQLLDLDGKNLVCYCKPKACHGDVIVAAVKWVKENEPAFDQKVKDYQLALQKKIEENNNVVYKVRRKI